MKSRNIDPHFTIGGEMVSPEGELVVDLNTPVQNLQLQHKIQNAKSIMDLVLAIEYVKGIKGSQKFYTQLELAKQLMERVWTGNHVDSKITNTFGWRDKINELLRDNRPIATEYEKAREYIENQVKGSRDINELIERIRMFTGVLTKDHKMYTCLEILWAIRHAIMHPGDPDRYKYITKEFGLREKVKELMRSRGANSTLDSI